MFATGEPTGKRRKWNANGRMEVKEGRRVGASAPADLTNEGR
jgi:hypothetical protein